MTTHGTIIAQTFRDRGFESTETKNGVYVSLIRRLYSSEVIEVIADEGLPIEGEDIKVVDGFQVFIDLRGYA